MRGRNYTVGTLLLAVLLATCSDGQGTVESAEDAGGDVTEQNLDPLRYTDRATAWLEFWEPDELAETMAFANTHRLNVNIAFIRDVHDQDDLTAACDAAATQEVAIRLWPLLPEDLGYWPNQGNVDAFFTYVDQLLQWAPESCPQLDGIVVDLELSIDRVHQLSALFEESGSITDIVNYLLEGIDEETFEQARLRYAEEVQSIQDRGWTVSCTAWPLIADDFYDEDETLAMMLWSPVEGIGWDSVSIMVYRSMFNTQFANALPDSSSDFTSFVVASYAATMRERYGDRAAVDVGITGTGVISLEGLESAEELQSDIAAALGAGIELNRIAVYSLEGVMSHDDGPDWVAVPTPATPEDDGVTDRIRGLFSFLDSMHP